MLESAVVIALAAIVGIFAGQLLVRRRFLAVAVVSLYIALLVTYWLTGTDVASLSEPVTLPGPEYFA